MFLGVDERARALGTDLVKGQESTFEKLTRGPGILIGEGLADKLGAERGLGGNRLLERRQQPDRGPRRYHRRGGQFSEGMFALSAIPVAQQVLGKGPTLDSIFVIAEPGVELDELGRELGQQIGVSAFVDSPSGRVRQAQSSTASLRFGMLMGVAIAVTVGAFLVYNTMSMAALERRREIATIRALGGGRRKLLGLLLVEAALLGLIGSAMGAAFGYFLARVLVMSIPDYYATQVEVALTVNMPSYAIPLALVIGIVSSVVAALMPARQAVTVAPAASMRPVGVLESLEEINGISPVPTVLGFLLVIVSYSAAVWGPGSLAFVAMGGLVAGSIVSTFGLTYPLAQIDRQPGIEVRRGRPAGRFLGTPLAPPGVGDQCGGGRRSRHDRHPGQRHREHQRVGYPQRELARPGRPLRLGGLRASRWPPRSCCLPSGRTQLEAIPGVEHGEHQHLHLRQLRGSEDPGAGNEQLAGLGAGDGRDHPRTAGRGGGGRGRGRVAPLHRPFRRRGGRHADAARRRSGSARSR